MKGAHPAFCLQQVRKAHTAFLCLRIKELQVAADLCIFCANIVSNQNRHHSWGDLLDLTRLLSDPKPDDLLNTVDPETLGIAI